MSGHRVLCKQLSIDSVPPQEGVFFFDGPVPEVPTTGARVQVACAGVCYKKRSSVDAGTPPPSPSIHGIRDASLFPGFEVAGVIDRLGPDVPIDSGFSNGDKVIVFPHDDLPSISTGYAEYISVPNIKYLVKIPPSVPLSVAAMLPSGALWAMNAVQIVGQNMTTFIDKYGKCNILIVGTGGLALWTLRISNQFLTEHKNKVNITSAVLKDERIALAQEHSPGNIVSWNEEVYESLLIERTKDACGGEVDIALDFGADARTLSRLIKCMRLEGLILVGTEAKDSYGPKFSQELSKKNITLDAVSMGNLEQLQQLVNLVAEGKVIPPKYSVFSIENAPEVFKQLCKSQIDGRAILEFSKME